MGITITGGISITGNVTIGNVAVPVNTIIEQNQITQIVTETGSGSQTLIEETN